MFGAINPKTVRYGPGLSIASNGSLAVTPVFMAPYAGEVVAARFHNGGRTTIASATTTGSGVTITIYKNASNAGSIVGTLTSSGTAIGSTVAGMKFVLSSTASLKKFAADDVLLLEVTQGANSAVAFAVSWLVDLDVVYGTED